MTTDRPPLPGVKVLDLTRPFPGPAKAAPEPAAQARAEFAAAIASRTPAQWGRRSPAKTAAVRPCWTSRRRCSTNTSQRARWCGNPATPHYGAATHPACPGRMTGYPFDIERQALLADERPTAPPLQHPPANPP